MTTLKKMWKSMGTDNRLKIIILAFVCFQFGNIVSSSVRAIGGNIFTYFFVSSPVLITAVICVNKIFKNIKYKEVKK